MNGPTPEGPDQGSHRQKNPPLELASLPERHPDLGRALLSTYGMMATIRLSLDPRPPTPLASDAVCRVVSISHRPEDSLEERVLEREIGWKGLEFTERDVIATINTCNSEEITEKAAIAVMGLIVSEIEKIRIKRVLPIGSGGDYAAIYSRSGLSTQVEVSGIRQGHPSVSHARLAEKCVQVLKTSSRGLVSVTTFHQIKTGGGVAHSFLHHVKSGERRPASRKRGPRSKGR